MATASVNQRAGEILSDLIGPLENEIGTLTARRDELLSEVSELSSTIRRLEKVRKAITGEPVTPGRAKTKPAKGRKLQVSEARIEQALEWAREQPGGEFTTADMTRHFEWGSGVSSHCTAELRERGIVRLIGKRGFSKAYALIDN